MNAAFYRGKRVFVTGHTGFKGGWLCRVLERFGAEVTGYALEPDPEGGYAAAEIGKGMTSVLGDVRDPERLGRAARDTRPELVFHLAAQPLVGVSYREPVSTYAVNVMGTAHLLDALRDCGEVRSIVIVTTDKVYENEGREEAFREEDRLCGGDPYSNSKSCAELVTAGFRKSFFEGPNAPALSTARAGNVIGGGDFAEGRIIPECVRAVRRGERVRLRSPGSVRPYQHVLDCLAGYLRLAERQYADKSLAGSYNFGPAETDCVTTEALARLFCRCWGEDAGWTCGEAGGFTEAGLLRLRIEKAERLLDWRPLWDIRRAMEETVRLYRAECFAEEMDCQIDRYQSKC